jgi:hypothetical protein
MTRSDTLRSIALWADWEWCTEHDRPRWSGPSSCRDLHPFAATLAPWCFTCERTHKATEWKDNCEGEETVLW